MLPLGGAMSLLEVRLLQLLLCLGDASCRVIWMLLVSQGLSVGSGAMYGPPPDCKGKVEG
jgi:hypothetical protein